MSLKALIAEQLGISEEEVGDNSHFIEDLGGDALDVVEIIMEVEEVYELEISEEDAVKLLTYIDLYDYIEAHK